MTVVFEQVFILFVFALAGYLLSKCALIDPAHSKLLSSLLVYVFLPANVLKTFASNCTPDYLREKYPLVIGGVVITALLVLGAYFGAKLFAKGDYQRKIYRYALAVPNYSYMGYALAGSLLGSAGLLNIMLFSMGLVVYNYVGAFPMLTKRKTSFRSLLNPMIIAVILGIAAGLLKIELPTVVGTVMDKAGACLGPISMLLAGIAVSEFRMPELLRDWKAYVVTLLRLLVIPMLLGAALIPFRNPVLTQCAVLLFAMPCGLNTIVFPKMVGEDCGIGASLACISNILACVTIPAVCAVFQIG